MPGYTPISAVGSEKSKVVVRSLGQGAAFFAAINPFDLFVFGAVFEVFLLRTHHDRPSRTTAVQNSSTLSQGFCLEPLLGAIRSELRSHLLMV